jgi:hypothetical protein
MLNYRTTFHFLISRGVYLSKDRRDIKFTFDGSVYTFQHGKKVNFAFAELLFQIYEHALSSIDGLVASQPVRLMTPKRWI